MSGQRNGAVRAEVVDRLPPHSMEAERAVLGCIMLDPVAALSTAATRLNGNKEVFYDLRHQTIFECMCEMADQQQPIDSVTLSRWITFQGGIEQIGGMTYLIGLPDATPSASNINYYLDTLMDCYRSRQLIKICTESVGTVYDNEGNPASIIDSTSQQLMQLASSQVSEEEVSMRDLTMRAIDTIEQAQNRQGVLTGLSTGFSDLDHMTSGLHNGEMIVIAARPSMGKTSLAMNIAEHVAIDLGLPVGVFSLEMTKDALVLRMLCSRARVNIRNIRDGFVAERDFPRLTGAAGRLHNAPIYINDTSGLSIMGLRTRARTMARKYGIKLFVVDYLQLLSAESSRRNDSRQDEVRLISYGLKGIAKELNVPVIALSQLNRNIERDKQRKPTLADLRECLSVKTSLLFTGDGVRCNLGSRMNTYSLSKSGSVTVKTSENIPKGKNEVLRVKLESGRFIDCTARHKILTDRGWVEAQHITREHSIASVRKIDEPAGCIDIPEAHWIGWMLGNGSMVGYSSPSFICSDETVAKLFEVKTMELFGLQPRPHKHACKSVYQYDITAGPVRTVEGNPCKNWLRSHGLWGRRSFEKRIPDWFMQQANNASISEIVAGLWETDGTVTQGILKYSTTSSELAWQVVWCLARLGIFCYLDDGFLGAKSKHSCFTVRIADGRDVKLFRQTVSINGVKGLRLAGYIPSDHGSNHGDRLGVWVSNEILKAIKIANISYSKAGYRPQSKRISQSDLRKVIGRVPGLSGLSHLVNPAIYWDRLDSCEPMGKESVFDRTVPGAHNFVANGIIVHNSGAIEQDADLVGLLYRPREYYNEDPAPEDEHAVNINLSIAKQRNGPTGEVALTFLKSFTRFESAARVSAEDMPPEAPQQEMGL